MKIQELITFPRNKFFNRQLRSLFNMQHVNDGTRALLESILAPEVQQAMQDWIAGTKGIDAVLIGGLALSYYMKPRYTSDGDFLFLNESAIPESVNGFKRTRKHAFEHKKTGVEIEVITPQYINMDPALAKAIFDTAVKHDGTRVASPSGIIAAKLGRFKPRDQADILELHEHQKIDLTSFPLSDELIARYNKLIEAGGIVSSK